ncbi:MAG: alpha/beta hydrolase [Oscillospiraceae bacterium]|jgi:pimeloyl-ACP methyl ester carboxylesterase|nr:alpha/beta hydrolase [Oscillospiraceae bacterium]
MNIKIDNIPVNYIKEGAGTPLLLLHGWGCNTETYRPLINNLKQKRTVYALDFPGFGKTPEPPHAFCVGDYAALTIKFCKLLGIETPDIFAHSMGCRVFLMMNAAGFAANKVVITGGAGIKHTSDRLSLRTRVYKLASSLLKTLHAEKSLERLRRHFGSEDYRNGTPKMRETLVKIVNEDLTPFISLVKNDTLLVWGSLDTAAPLADGERMAHFMPNSGLAVMDGCGHYAFLERTDWFISIVDNFL